MTDNTHKNNAALRTLEEGVKTEDDGELAGEERLEYVDGGGTGKGVEKDILVCVFSEDLYKQHRYRVNWLNMQPLSTHIIIRFTEAGS